MSFGQSQQSLYILSQSRRKTYDTVQGRETRITKNWLKTHIIFGDRVIPKRKRFYYFLEHA